MDPELTPPSPPAGVIAAANISRLRSDQRFTYAALARELAAIGNPIPELGLRRLEQGKRRIDVDDLVAFARVFKVTPVELLATPGEVATGESADAMPPGIVLEIPISGGGNFDRMFAEMIRQYVRRGLV